MICFLKWHFSIKLTDLQHLRDGNETCYDVWFANSGTKKGGQAGGGRVVDSKIFNGKLEMIISEAQRRLSSFDDKVGEARLRRCGHVEEGEWI